MCMCSVGRMNDVGECMATYQYLEPSDGTMDKKEHFLLLVKAESTRRKVYS